MSQKIKIDDVEYEVDAMSEIAKTQLMHLRMVDMELGRLQGQMAIHQTARVAYLNALKAELTKPESPKA